MFPFVFEYHNEIMCFCIFRGLGVYCSHELFFLTPRGRGGTKTTDSVGGGLRCPSFVGVVGPCCLVVGDWCSVALSAQCDLSHLTEEYNVFLCP